ncbi:MAG TPA: PepSY domain-containing protein [bacterium]|jgi:hypothetical protein
MMNVRHTARYALAAILALGIFGFAMAAEGKKEEGPEKKIAKKDLPAAVFSSFQKAYPAAKIVGTSQETEDSTTYFEIESRDGKVKRDILYKADGTVKEIEEGVAKASLPVAVKDAIAKEYPKGIIQKGEKTTRDNVVSYEVILKNGKDRMEVVVDETGKVLKTEKMTRQEEKEEKAEGKK